MTALMMSNMADRTFNCESTLDRVEASILKITELLSSTKYNLINPVNNELSAMVTKESNTINTKEV